MKLDSVESLSKRIEEVEEEIQGLESLKNELVSELRKLERKFGKGGECPECGSDNSVKKRGFARVYTIECQSCGFKVYGSD